MLFQCERHALHTFVDTFQGNYKDGTPGTCDLQAFFSPHLNCNSNSHLIPGCYTSVMKLYSNHYCICPVARINFSTMKMSRLKCCRGTSTSDDVIQDSPM